MRKARSRRAGLGLPFLGKLANSAVGTRLLDCEEVRRRRELANRIGTASCDVFNVHLRGRRSNSEMLVSGNRQSWRVENENELDDVLARRDSRGGCVFWLTHDDEFPCLCIRISGDVGDVPFFPHEDHPGFRCLGGQGLPEGEWTTLLFNGCDPGHGEETPNEFVVSFSAACLIAKEFLVNAKLPANFSWLEL